MQVQKQAAIVAVRVAKFLAAHGVDIHRFDVSSEGRSYYINARIGSRRFKIRISDHLPAGGRKNHGRAYDRFISFPCTWQWVIIRKKIKHYITHQL